MKALDRKLLRDLRLMWSQALTIACVVAGGIAGFLTTLSAVDSLELARDRFYATGAFADVFASVKRAPRAAAEGLRELPGVADVQAGVRQVVRVDLPDSTDPVLGQLIGLDPQAPPAMNRVLVVAGRPLAEAATDGRAIPALVSAGFAAKRGLAPGARLAAVLNGRRRTLEISGIALSPEFIFAGMMGVPDQRGFGVFWVPHEALAAAFDMDGAFNHVSIRLAPGAAAGPVIDALGERLARYGGREAQGRDEQASHAMLDNEIRSQRVLGTVLPAIFLGVAAFLLNVVVTRLVSTQREQIATLKALGYGDAPIAGHFLRLVLVIVAVGALLGVALGDRLGGLLTGLYAEFFAFPQFDHRLSPGLVLTGVGATAAAAVAGTLGAILATVRLAPAEAMRPPAPGRFHRSGLERLVGERLSPALRMILRQLERRPWRSVLGVVGIAASVAIVVMGNSFRDAIDAIVDGQFNVAMRSDVIVWLVEPVAAGAALEVARLPGARLVEPGRDVPVRFVHGHREERGAIRGLPPRPELNRIVDDRLREASRLEDDGLVMTDRLAAKLGLRVGDAVRVEVLEGRQRTVDVPLAATVRETMGLNAYMARRALNRVLGEGDLATWFAVAVEPGREPALLEASRAMPRIVGVFSKSTLLRNMQDVSARNVRIMSTVLTLFAVVIAVGVVYNNARIALAERTWELASLRVLGFSRAEVSGLLLGEQAIQIALALPLGMVLGDALMRVLVRAMASDQFLFPVVIRPSTFAGAALVVLVAAALSALVVRRRIDTLDLVGALKTRE